MSISVSYTKEYQDNLDLLSQQKNSRFREAVMTGKHVGDGASPADQLAETNAVRNSTRHAAKPMIEQTHDRRWVYPVFYDWGASADNQDKLQMLIQPDGQYTKAGLAAINRGIDDEIIASFFATAKTGNAGGTSTTFPAANQVAVTVGASGDTGLNTDKLLAGRELILAGNVDIDDPDNQIYCAINANYEHQLLEQIKVSNRDYAQPIFAGDGKTLKHWFGINFIITQRLATDSNSDVRVPMWCKSGMHLGIWNDVTANIVQRDDLARNPYHVSTWATIGATRLEEAKVVELICDPT